MKCGSLLFTLIAWVLIVATSWDTSLAEPQPSTSDLTDLLMERDRELQAIAAVYRGVSNKDDSGDIVGGYLRRFVAARSPGWFFRDNGHGHSRLHWLQDPLRKSLLVSPCKAILLENLNRVVLDLGSDVDNVARSSVQSELLFYALCWWPYSNWPAPEVFGRSWSISSLLAEGRYILRSGVAFIDDQPCLVLEVPGVDEIWLSASSPHYIVRRDVFDDQTGALASRSDFSGYTHHGGNIWLPKKFTNQLYDSRTLSKERQNRMVFDSEFEMLEVRVNGEVVAEDFELDLPAGTVRLENRDGIEHLCPLVSGQGEHAKAIIEWASNLRTYDSNPAPSVRDSGRSVVWSILGLLIGFALGLLSVSLVKKASRTRSMPTMSSQTSKPD